MSHDVLASLDPKIDPAAVAFTGEGVLPSAFRVTDLAAASTAWVGHEAVRLAELLGGPADVPVVVDRRLASWWFASSLVPDGWTLPSPWDDLAGDYETADGGWVKLHTNAPHHRRAALSVLDGATDRTAVAAAVAARTADEVERAVVGAGGCAAALRSAADWARHPQGAAVRAEPLVATRTTAACGRPAPSSPPDRPLRGVRVLDLTRVLAGPVATRLLAGLGADVVRIDPPDWGEPAVVPEVTLGKRCARLDARTAAGRDALVALLRDADVLVHGYRPGALEHLGLGDDARAELAPGLVEVALCAYGWTGPWAGRRGFDSLVQMSSGIAHTGRDRRGGAAPVPLPVQALDHATGHVLAAAALAGWRTRLTDGVGSVHRASLARTAVVLADAGDGSFDDTLEPPGPADTMSEPETTPWGTAHRLRSPLAVPGVPFAWDRASCALGSHPPTW
ncbi:MAG: CoA transferase [Acidimicrobiales bacterium]